MNYPTTPLANVAYTICVRREVGMCAINWSEAATTTDSFDLDNGTDGATDGTCVSLTEFKCIYGTKSFSYDNSKQKCSTYKFRGPFLWSLWKH